MKRFFWLGGAALFILLLLSGCGGNNPEFPPVHSQIDVEGKVVDSVTGQGLAGAEVMLRDFPNRLDLTADDGSFFLPLVPSGRQVFIVSLYGYQKKSEAFQIPASGIWRVEIELDPLLGKLVGYVYDSEGQAVAGATVTVDGKYTTTTSTDGQFSFSQLPTGSYIITVEKEGFVPSSGEVKVEPPAITFLEITLSLPGGS